MRTRQVLHPPHEYKKSPAVFGIVMYSSVGTIIFDPFSFSGTIWRLLSVRKEENFELIELRLLFQWQGQV